MQDNVKLPSVRTVAISTFAALVAIKLGVGGKETVAMGVAQTISVVMAGGFGFALGWVLSPQAHMFRLAIGLILAALLILLAIGDRSPFGITITTGFALLAFAAALSFWIGTAMKGFSGVRPRSARRNGRRCLISKSKASSAKAVFGWGRFRRAIRLCRRTMRATAIC